MDLFAKCYEPSLADEVREKNIYPYFHALETRQGPEVVMEGKRRIMLGSNNYLGLTSCPEVIEAGLKALERYGTGCSGSRFLNGTLLLHRELEAELAEFLKEVKFERLGVFTFSCEEGTPAANIKEGIVSEKTKQRRYDTLMQNQFTIHENFNKSMLGRTLEVVCEGYDKASGVYFGRSVYDCPDIDGKVYFSSKQRRIKEGEFVNVKVDEVLDYDLLGEVIL